jgi:hypothetical protein
VERTFAEDIALPGPNSPAQASLTFIENNSLDGVTWLHSYVTPDAKKSFCIYDAPTPEALRRAARRNGLPVDRIIEVRVLDPYFYLEKAGYPVTGA